MGTTLLVDGHVHYHPCFGVAPFLEAALANFRAASGEIGEPDAVGCLMFSESSWNHYFRAFAEGLIEQRAPGWSVATTEEDGSLFACAGSGTRLLLIAGRQIVTAERLEVLALATTCEYADGLAFREAIRVVVSSGAIPVLPWGFGKWTGSRGRVVRAVLSSPAGDELYVGDNGGRPELSPDPSLFRLAKDRRIPVLPGSDPLPIPAEVKKPGRCGFVLRGTLDSRAPAAAIRRMIATRSPAQRFGRLERPGTFVLRQTQLRLRPRRVEREAIAVDGEPQRS